VLDAEDCTRASLCTLPMPNALYQNSKALQTPVMSCHPAAPGHAQRTAYVCDSCGYDLTCRCRPCLIRLVCLPACTLSSPLFHPHPQTLKSFVVGSPGQTHPCVRAALACSVLASCLIRLVCVPCPPPPPPLPPQALESFVVGSPGDVKPFMDQLLAEALTYLRCVQHTGV
jgi:hypothetical protein